MSYIPPVAATGGALDDSIQLLQRILKNVETLSVVDVAQRQRVTIDAITASLTLSNVTTVTTVSAVTAITNALPTGTNTIGNVNVGGMDREMYINQSIIAYNTGIRSKLN